MSSENDVYDRLIIRGDVWAKQSRTANKNGTYPYFKVSSKITSQEIEKSLHSNEKTIGVYTVKPTDNTVINPTIDIDNHDGKTDILTDVKTVYNALKTAGMSPYIEASAGELKDGAHIGVICKPTLAATAKRAIQKILDSTELKHEVNPKQEEIKEDGYGNLVKLPWQYNNRTKQRSQIIDPDTFEPMERQLAINYMLALPDTVFECEQAIEIPIQTIRKIPEATAETIKSDMNFDDVFGLKNIKPCVIKAYNEKWILHGKGDEGHNFRLAIAGDLFFNGADDEVVLEYFSIQPDFSRKETENGIKSIRKYLAGGNKRPMGCKAIQKKCIDIIGEMCETCKRNPFLSSQKEAHKDSKAPLELPPIPQETIEPTPITIQDALNVFEEHLYVEEHFNITIPLSEVIANFSPIEPDIIGIIGPSGSAKTEMIRALGETENQFCYPVSSITSHTLVSGLPENIDLAPMLRGRILTIKDLTTILSKNKDMVSEIFADFRELTDGHIGKDFGSGVKKHYTGIHSSVLFGCTNAIEAHNSIFSVLGQRILFFRPRNDKRKSMDKAISNNGKETAIRISLHKITLQLINTMLTKHRVRLENLTQNLLKEYLQDIGDIACFLANVRTHISRDYRGDMAALPEPEYPTRLAKTLCKLVDAHSILYDRETTDQDMKIAYRLASDNIPTERLKVLTVLLDGEPRSTTEVQTEAKIPTTTARRILDDLKTLEIIDFFSMGAGKPDIWQLSNVEYLKILTKIIEKTKPEKKKPVPVSDEPRGEIRQGVYVSPLDPIHLKGYTKKIFIKEDETNTVSNSESCSHISESHPTLDHDVEPQKNDFDSKIVMEIAFNLKEWYDSANQMNKASWDYVLNDIMVKHDLRMDIARNYVDEARQKIGW